MVMDTNFSIKRILHNKKNYALCIVHCTFFTNFASS